MVGHSEFVTNQISPLKMFLAPLLALIYSECFMYKIVNGQKNIKTIYFLPLNTFLRT